MQAGSRDGRGKEMQSDPIAVARASYIAYANKDRAAIEALIADDFHFTSPLDNRLNRATYFERCWPNSRMIDRFEFIHTVLDGDRVFVTYEGRSNTGKRFRNSEILTVHEGKIVEAEVYFGWTIPHEAAEGSFITEEK
jgi:ketosteroid isomerase-like protein